MAVAGLTDVLDGWVARRTGAAGRRSAGAWLDPLCDKLFMVSLLAAVWFAAKPGASVLVLLAARECLQLPLLLAFPFVPRIGGRERFDFTAALLGKATTVAQFIAISVILFRPDWATVPAAATAPLGTAAAIRYWARALG